MVHLCDFRVIEPELPPLFDDLFELVILGSATVDFFGP
jgi:hypothetical protein